MGGCLFAMAYGAATHGVAAPVTSWRDGRTRVINVFLCARCAWLAALPCARLPRYAASLTRAARRARTASARLSNTASELSQPMQPSVMLWP
jgi:hypothetical protein